MYANSRSVNLSQRSHALKLACSHYPSVVHSSQPIEPLVSDVSKKEFYANIVPSTQVQPRGPRTTTPLVRTVVCANSWSVNLSKSLIPLLTLSQCLKSADSAHCERCVKEGVICEYRPVDPNSTSNSYTSNSRKPHTCFPNCHLPQYLLGTTNCWIAAEHALQHAKNNISLVSEVFGRWQIQKSEYVVHAGFDESLIKSGVGYLEQIHVFVITEVDATSPLLSELGRLFSPFSSILFTESSSYCLPVFKDDGSVWEFDELVYFTASKVADGGSSAKTPLTIISLSSQTPSLADGMAGFSQSSSGSGEGGKNKKRRLEKGKERDTGDNNDKGCKDNKDPSDNPNDLLGDQGAGPAKIFFEIASEIHHLIEDKWNTFQTLTMHGSLTIEVLLYHYCMVVLPN